MTEKPKNPKNPKNQNKPVFSADLAGKLIDRGFQMVDQKRNYSNPRLWVYYFEDTDELEKAWTELVSK